MDIRTIVVFILLFAVLVFVHEFGHFLTARLTGMRVLEFGFGFPPRAIGIRRPAAYAVVRGAVTLEAEGRRLALGEGDRVVVRRPRNAWVLERGTDSFRLAEGERFTATGSARFRPGWARTAQGDFDVVPSEYRAGSGDPALFPFQPGIEYSINWIPFGGFVRILGEDGMARTPEGDLAPDSFAGRPIPARMLVLVAGVLMNVVLAFVVYTSIFATGEPTFNGKVQWATVDPGSPAQAAGMRDGDVITSIDGKTFTEPGQMRDYIYGKAGSPIRIAIERGGETLDVTATPRADPPANQGPLGLRDATAVRELVAYPLPEAIARSAERTGVVLGEIVRAFSHLITGAVTGQGAQDVSGPVGIFNITGQVAQEGVAYVLELLALLSLNLAVLNIVPFPGLDGGRLLFVVIEAVRGGRRVDPRTEAAIHALGFMFLLLLVGVVSFFDIRRLAGG